MGYNRAMRFRLGYVFGFGCGYYLGAKAGRSRYEQLNEMLDKVRSSETFESTAEKARSIVEPQVERVRGVVEERVGQAKEAGDQSQGNGHQAAGIDLDQLPPDLPPGPPAAGSLTDERPPGGPPG